VFYNNTIKGIYICSATPYNACTTDGDCVSGTCNFLYAPGFGEANSPLAWKNSRTSTAGVAGADPYAAYCDATEEKFCLHGAKLCTGDGNRDCATGTGPCVLLDGPAGTSGYPCRDQIGTGKTNATTGVQDIEPVYFWNNNWCYGPFGVCTPMTTIDYAHSIRDDGSRTSIQDNRDVFFSASKPVAMSGYTPYTCPHPLAGAGSCDTNTSGASGYVLTGGAEPITGNQSFGSTTASGAGRKMGSTTASGAGITLQ
jgi:hypothetical protein